jgi:hypothetical protein
MSTLEQFLSVALLTPIFDPMSHTSPGDPSVIWGVPVNLIGLSGIAKTARIKQIARAAGMPAHSVYAPTKQPEDFTGAYVPTAEGLVIECVLPAARKCIDRGFGCIHLSELSSARAAVQAALLSVVSERQIGDHLLPPRTRFLVDMNPPEYAAGGYALEAPMANRLAHYDYTTPTNKSFSDYLTGQAEQVISMAKGEPQVIGNWNKHWPHVVGAMVGFLQSTPQENIVKQPKPDDPNSGGSWPSLRTWHYALCAITASRCLSANQAIELEFAQSLVGKGAASAWSEWMVKADLPDPLDMLTKGWKPDRKRLDRTVASLTAMTEYLKGLTVTHRKDAVDLAEAAWCILGDTLAGNMGDLVVNPAQTLVLSKLGIVETTVQTTEAASDVIFDLTKKGYAQFATSK